MALGSSSTVTDEEDAANRARSVHDGNWEACMEFGRPNGRNILRSTVGQETKMLAEGEVRTCLCVPAVSTMAKWRVRRRSQRPRLCMLAGASSVKQARVLCHLRRGVRQAGRGERRRLGASRSMVTMAAPFFTRSSRAVDRICSAASLCIARGPRPRMRARREEGTRRGCRGEMAQKMMIRRG